LCLSIGDDAAEGSHSSGSQASEHDADDADDADDAESASEAASASDTAGPTEPPHPQAVLTGRAAGGFGLEFNPVKQHVLLGGDSQGGVQLWDVTAVSSSSSGVPRIAPVQVRLPLLGWVLVEGAEYGALCGLQGYCAALGL
jgi:hypothetical protein